MTTKWTSGCVALLLVSAVVHGCARDLPPSVETDDESRDTTTVVNNAPLVEGGGHLLEVSRLGTLNGPPGTQLANVLRFTVAHTGQTYVFEGNGGIKIFEADGSFSGWVARQGQGPNEVGHVTGMAYDDFGGNLAVYDVGNGRISVFGSDGQVRSVPQGSLRPSYAEDALAYDQNGRLWVGLEPRLSLEQPTLRYPRPIFAHLDTSGALVDTVWAGTDLLDRCPTLGEAQYQNGFWQDKRSPFVPMALWALGADGSIAFGCPADYSFRIERPDRTVLKISRLWEPLRLGQQAKVFFEAWAPMPVLPTRRPAYARIVLTPDRRAWVWPTQPFERYALSSSLGARVGRNDAWRLAEGGAFDVFDEYGRWVGSVRLPPAVRYTGYPTTPPVTIRGDTIWAVGRDALDVEYIVKYMVRWGESL